MKIKLMLIPFMFVFISGCSCLFSNSSDLKKIMNPLQIQLVDFYKEHSRYPNDKELDELLIKSGCKLKDIIGSKYCAFSGKDIRFSSFYRTLSDRYSIRFDYKKTHCFLDQNKNRIKISCTKSPCIQIGH